MTTVHYTDTHTDTHRHTLTQTDTHRLTTYGGRAFCYVGPSTCNALPDFLKNDTLSLSAFRRQLKHFYFSLYQHSEHVPGYFIVTHYTNYLLTYTHCSSS